MTTVLKVGEVESVWRYPVKSMRGESVPLATLGWHGLAGDRRLALRRLEDRGGFPWLTASRWPALLLHEPYGRAESRDGLPTHVRTPQGHAWPLFDAGLAEEIGQFVGQPLEMTHLDRGIFDDAPVSILTAATAAEIARRVGARADVLRFRPNIVVRTDAGLPFEEDGWVGSRLRFGGGDAGAAAAAEVMVTHLDERCAMVNFDPVTARTDARWLKTIVRERGNCAGVYGATRVPGRIEVGQAVFADLAAR
jgi:uncharacterized protein YcbX